MENVLTIGVSLQNRIEYSIITLQRISFLNSFGFFICLYFTSSPLQVGFFVLYGFSIFKMQNSKMFYYKKNSLFLTIAWFIVVAIIKK